MLAVAAGSWQGLRRAERFGRVRDASARGRTIPRRALIPDGAGIQSSAMKKYLPLFVVVTLAVVVGSLLVRWLFDSGHQAQQALADAANQTRGPVGFAQLPPAAL